MTLSKSKLGRTRLDVSDLCLGTNQFGTTLDHGAANGLLDAFVAAGGNFIDSARVYGDYSTKVPTGPSERAIGTWIASRGRDKIVLSTKGGAGDVRNGSYGSRLSRADLLKDLAESLDHLQTDHIDLYWLHYDDEAISVEAIYDTMVEQQTAGKFSHLGASNWSPARIRELQAYAASIGREGFVAIQPSWGLAVPNRAAAKSQGYDSWFEDGFREFQEAGLAVVPFGAQSRGYFTKLDRADTVEVPAKLVAQYGNAHNERLLSIVRELAEKYDATINQIGLAYLLSQPARTVPIIGPQSIDQLNEAVGAAGIKLSEAELAQLSPTE